MTSPFTIDGAPIPSEPGGDGWQVFVEMTVVRNACEAAGYGTTEMAAPPEDVLNMWLSDPGERRRLLVATVDGRVVGRALCATQLDDDVPHAWLTVEVLEEFRGRGIGTALSDAVEALAHADGRSRMVVYTVSPDGPGERLAPPTGFGAVPLGNPEVRFLLGRGYVLEQVERGSRLALPLDDASIAAHYDTAERAAGEDYRVHVWRGSVPEHWLVDLALLYTRMSTDAPSAGLDEPEDVWTVDRVRGQDAVRASGTTDFLTAVVEHVPSGALAGFSFLRVPQELDRAVDQLDTLVLREHRGHRLGMLLKAANLRFLAEEHPGHPSVVTFNAEENRPMLDVNEALGFVPMGYEGAWRRDDVLEPVEGARRSL